MLATSEVRADGPFLYLVSPLGGLGSACVEPCAQSYALAVNSTGDTVGYSRLADGTSHAVRLGRLSTTDLDGGSPTVPSVAYAIDSSGAIAGYRGSFLFQRATLYRSGSLTTLAATRSAAFGMNDDGDVVGYYTPSGFPIGTISKAFMWDADHGSRDLGAYIGGGTTSSTAYAINNFWQLDVVGHYLVPSTGVQHAFRINGTVLNGASSSFRDLGTLGGLSSHAYAINDLREVVGCADTASAASHAVFWSPAAIPSDLHTPGVNVLDSSCAYGINEDSTIVGSFNSTTGSRAFVRLRHESFWRDLNDVEFLDPSLGWVLLEARGVSDRGDIVGVGSIGGVKRGYRLSPSTVPTSLVFSPSRVQAGEIAQGVVSLSNAVPAGTGTLGMPIFVSDYTAAFSEVEVQRIPPGATSARVPIHAQDSVSGPVSITVSAYLGAARVEAGLEVVPDEICNNGIDDDLDEKVDCFDSECNLKACACGVCMAAVCKHSELSCADGLDNDCDGKTDCADPECDTKRCAGIGNYCSLQSCQNVETWCDNREDDDFDGPADCADSDCDGRECAPGQYCVAGACE